MRARLMVVALAAASLLGGACSDDLKPAGKADMAGGGICPSNPQFCAGTCCGTACVQTDLDKNNCGGCGTTCEAGQVCAKSKCGCLPSGADPQTDPKNCGTCGHECGAGATCSAGKCQCNGTECSASETCCNGTCSATCTQPDMASGLVGCDCSGLQDFFGTRCPLSNTCVAKNCCFENTQGNPLLMMCSATPTLCSPSAM